MSKIFVGLFLIFIAFFAPEAYANSLPDCAVAIAKTEPSPLFSDPKKMPSKAKFIVNVGNNKDYSGWKLKFDCGGNKDKAILENNDDEIYREKNVGGCEFEPGNHSITISAITPNGEVNQCKAQYNVIDSDTQCLLDINPKTDITSATTLTVSGSNLTDGGRFGLFFDDMQVGDALVGTPTFSAITIPQNRLTPNSHTVSLRKYNFWKSIIKGVLMREDSWGSPLCPQTIIVGTTSKPGGVIPSAGKKDFGPLVNSLGKQCGTSNDPDGPGIGTAIGCLHTNPPSLVKDLFKFLIGIGGGLAFLMMLLGAFQMITSGGNPDTLKAGRERLTSAVIGLLFIIFSILFLKIIGVDILKIPGFV
ncbi:hypothetical protein HYS95_03245 [Candidatus Daviesbacteria bacterium]|nr:hypothetical protein [Candidatus Daviesbacteria bacterium]